MYPVIIKTVLVVSLIAASTTLFAGVSGQPANIEDFPFVAFINSQESEFPNLGIIVNERFIVTTGWMTYFISLNIKESSVKVGATNVVEDAEIYHIKKAITHKKLHTLPEVYDYNIGLLKLAKSLTFGPKVAAAIFARKDFKKGTKVNIIRVDERTNDYEMKLHTGSYLNGRNCKRSYTGWPWRDITQREFCVLEERDVNLLRMDDGSPVVLNGTVIGFSLLNNDNFDGPGLYLKISYFLKWIERQKAQNT